MFKFNMYNMAFTVMKVVLNWLPMIDSAINNKELMDWIKVGLAVVVVGGVVVLFNQ